MADSEPEVDAAEGPPAPEYGPVEAATRADVENLITAHPMGEALAEVAYALARFLDAGAGLATAGVAKELRSTLTELARLGVDGDDELDTDLSTPVRDEADPE